MHQAKAAGHLHMDNREALDIGVAQNIGQLLLMRLNVIQLGAGNRNGVAL
jgi:hypothetical protein